MQGAFGYFLLIKGNITGLVNGRKVNEAYDIFPAAGKILLQCEGSEVFYRRVELRPLAKENDK